VTLASGPVGPPLPRDEFSLADGVVYLNSAVMSPLPQRAVTAMVADARRAAAQASAAYDSRIGEVEVVRDAAATLMGVGVDDVAFVRNTTEGLGLVAAGLDWRTGDAVVVASRDHPNTVLPWRARSDAGVEVIAVDRLGPTGALPLDAFAAALDAGRGRVRVVAVSWVQADTGWRADLAALARRAHAHGALLCVDAIQGLGVVPCDLAA
jgi:selenocysteine lyase/cysteine desulfurase